MLCATATIALFLPRRRAIRWKRGLRYVPRVRAAAHATSPRMARAQTLPLVVFPDRRRPPALLVARTDADPRGQVLG